MSIARKVSTASDVGYLHAENAFIGVLSTTSTNVSTETVANLTTTSSLNAAGSGITLTGSVTPLNTYSGSTSTVVPVYSGGGSTGSTSIATLTLAKLGVKVSGKLVYNTGIALVGLTANTLIFTGIVPAGYRPTTDVVFPVYFFAGTGVNGVARVSAAGDLTLGLAGGNPIGNFTADVTINVYGTPLQWNTALPA